MRFGKRLNPFTVRRAAQNGTEFIREPSPVDFRTRYEFLATQMRSVQSFRPQ